MKEYSSDAPEFSNGINIVETTDLVNADNNNAAPKQLLQNDLVLHALIEALTLQLENNTKAAKDYTDVNYQQATGYTDKAIADLIGGAPELRNTLKELSDAIDENSDVAEALNAAIGKKADSDVIESLLGEKLDKTGDSGDTTAGFTSSDTLTPSKWSDFSLLTGREKLKEFAGKVSTVAKNLRWLYKMLGTTDISDLGDGTVTGALGELNSNSLKKSGGTLTGDLHLALNRIYFAEGSAQSYLEGNGIDLNIVNPGVSSSQGYVNLRTVNAVQARSIDNTRWIAMNAASFNTQSSKRYKENIEDMTDEQALDLLKLRIVTFDYINKSDGVNCEGLIAEDVAKVMLYPVFCQDGQVEGLDYSKFVPRLIKLLQMHEKRLSKLEEKP